MSDYTQCQVSQLAHFPLQRRLFRPFVVAAPSAADRPDPPDGLVDGGRADVDGGLAVAAAEAGDGPPDGAGKVARDARGSHRTPQKGTIQGDKSSRGHTGGRVPWLG